jgi:hypothetical protein
LILISLLAALLLPAVAFADGGPFYTTSDPDLEETNADASGTSLSTARWVDEDMGMLQEACKYFREDQGGTAGAWVYWYSHSEDRWYRFKLKDDGSCHPRSEPTEPPEDGVSVTPPLIVGGLFALGFLLLGAGWLLRQRLRTGARSA